YLRQIARAEDIDIIIALGMAKEGFDWPWCEHVLTIGFRSSMTEVVQIIGRATRDCEGKTHAQFTNLIAQPDAEDEDVKVSVNNMLKAITLSLLMEQILAPNVTFKPRSRMLPGEKLAPGTIIIDDTTNPVSDRVADILNTGSDELIAALIQKPEVARALISPTTDPEVINHTELPRIIETTYPDLNEEEREQVRQGVLTTMLIRSGGGVVSEPDLPEYADIIDAAGQEITGDTIPGDGTQERAEGGTRQFVKLGEKFINIEHINIDLIDRVNPFQGAYEILSKSVTAPMLKTIQEVATGGRIQMSEEEAVILWPQVIAFHKEKGREPSLTSSDQSEMRLAECLTYIKRKKMERAQKQASAAADPA
ncbi:MAG TPA: ATP-dependent helicase, partial [Pusillimonas sp.]|nr:ATP-dependent helicase [Pusillimonas sp.]